MISFFLKSAQSIIIAIIFIVIIEMLLPNNSNKKYIKVVSGIYLIITIVNPIVNCFNKKIDLEGFDFANSVETSSINVDLKSYYYKSFKETVKAELLENGYEIKDIELELNLDYSEIVAIKIRGAKKMDEEAIIEYFLQNYNLDREKIIFI